MKIYSSSTIRRGELNHQDVVDPYLGLPDEREEKHRGLQGSMSVAPIVGSLSMPTTTTTTTVAPVTTTEEPIICLTLYAPVCGVDGVTYGNSCNAEAAKVEVAYEGECKKPAAATTTAAPESAATTTAAPDTVDVTIDTIDATTTTAATPAFVLPIPDTPSPTPFPTKAMDAGGVNFAPEGAPSGAIMMGQSSGIVLATVMCAVAGMIVLV